MSCSVIMRLQGSTVYRTSTLISYGEGWSEFRSWENPRTMTVVSYSVFSTESLIQT